MRRPVWCKAFLVAVESVEFVGNISKCAEAAGVNRNNVYYRMKADPAFAADVARALASCEAKLIDAVAESCRKIA
jgi:DNA-binding phage protein